ncbi:phosphatase domain-containing protein [Micromonospora sp. CPCC 206061]|uniref:phosphatase domain-containing protein n=1 Tax=Micromonospora sp. CPCC 206061 TaxID=3122410 RepID=UPI003FA549F8
MLPRAVLFDVDGTLALRGDGPGVRAFYHWHRVGEDQPNPAIVELAQTIAAAGRHRIIVMSARDSVCRPETEEWLEDHNIPFDDLHMRAPRDNRKDAIVKQELYRQHIEGRYDVAFVVDDRNQVVRMWRDVLGLTVLQCADGDF